MCQNRVFGDDAAADIPMFSSAFVLRPNIN